MILTSLLTFIGLCFYQSTVRLNFSKALNFSYAYMQIAGFLKLFKLDICTKEIRFSHFRFPQKCGSINTSHFSCMSVASGLCFDFSLLISTWLLHCRVLVARQVMVPILTHEIITDLIYFLYIAKKLCTVGSIFTVKRQRKREKLPQMEL